MLFYNDLLSNWSNSSCLIAEFAAATLAVGTPVIRWVLLCKHTNYYFIIFLSWNFSDHLILINTLRSFFKINLIDFSSILIFQNIFHYLCHNCKYILKNNFEAHKKKNEFEDIISDVNFSKLCFKQIRLKNDQWCSNTYPDKFILQKIRISFYILCRWIIMNPITKDEITPACHIEFSYIQEETIFIFVANSKNYILQLFFPMSNLFINNVLL